MNFSQFILKHKNDDNMVGLFCKHAIQDSDYPSNKPFIKQLQYLEENKAPREALKSFVHSYKAWIDKT
tara:strand:+ start:775 stop:978 length:204 start_codon:yes stop_codon:yes gene_type:complete